MIVRFFKKGNPNVLGTVNTSGLTAEATGVGEPLLETWMNANKGTPTPDITRQLETFFASWNNAEKYSQIESPAEVPEETEKEK
jgi:hypothetical protein